MTFWSQKAQHRLGRPCRGRVFTSDFPTWRITVFSTSPWCRMGSYQEFWLLSVNKEQAQKGPKCLKNGGFPATKHEREKHKTKYLATCFFPKLFLRHQCLLSLMLAWLSSCCPLGSERWHPFDIKHHENRLLSVDLLGLASLIHPSF